MMKMHRLCGLILAAVALAQQPKRLTYEVVSVKPHAANDGRIMIGMGANSGGRLNLVGVPLPLAIQLAYNVGGLGGGGLGGGNNIQGLPGWAQTERFDIDARPEAGFIPSQDQMREMLRNLLEDRFGLKARVEKKDGPVYHLVATKDALSKNGLKKSADQTPLNMGATPPPPPPPPPGLGPGGPGAIAVRAGGTGGPTNPANMPRGMMMNGLGTLRATAQTMDQFARMLSGANTGRQVINKTGLDGLYDFDLSYTPENIPRLPEGAHLPEGVTLPDPNGPSIFTAVQEQLGLKLEGATAPIESIVVEHVERPAAN